MTTNSARLRSKLLRLPHVVGTIAFAAIILPVAGCNNTSPATPEAERSRSTAISNESTSGWKLDLKVAPDHPRMVRPARFALHIVDGAGKPVENAQATGSLTMALMDMGKTAVKFEPKGNGDYATTVPSFDMSGPWELTVDTTQGTVHARRVFQVTVSD
jgi:nitrogen fixation protein FixH